MKKCFISKVIIKCLIIQMMDMFPKLKSYEFPKASRKMISILFTCVILIKGLFKEKKYIYHVKTMFIHIFNPHLQ